MCFVMNNSPKFLLSSVFSGCLRTSQVILTVIRYSLNISHEWCSVCSSSSGSPLGSIQNESCMPNAPCICCVESSLQARTLLPPRMPKSSGFFASVRCWLYKLGPFSWAWALGMAMLIPRLQPDVLKPLLICSPVTGQAHMQVPSFGSSFV